MTKILQIGMIPHNMTLFKFIGVLCQFHRQTLPIMNIDRGQIPFRENDSTGTEPKKVIFINGFLKTFRIKLCITIFAFTNISYYSASTKSFRDTKI